MRLKKLSWVSSITAPSPSSILAVAGGTLDQLIAASFVMLLILVPFFAFRSLGEVVGEANLVRVFLHSRPRG